MLHFLKLNECICFLTYKFFPQQEKLDSNITPPVNVFQATFCIPYKGFRGYSKRTLTLNTLLVWLSLLGNICIAIICCPVCDDINFHIINLSFLIKPFFYITKKSRQKFTKRALNMNQKAFSIIFKGFSLKQKTLFWKIRVRL